jgi:hypothetical protein
LVAAAENPADKRALDAAEVPTVIAPVADTVVDVAIVVVPNAPIAAPAVK